MKKFYVVLILTLLFCISFIIPSFIIKPSFAYYGDGYCPNYHETNYINVPTDLNANIQLDGNNSESFWHKPSNQKGFISIKLSEERLGEEIPEIYTLNATFIKNNEYLLVFCEWDDITPNYSYPPDMDGLSFCWDINTKNFSAYYTSDMRTDDMGGGKVDVWSWTYRDGWNGREYQCNDDCFGEEGWLSEGTKNIWVAFDYSSEKQSYSLEMKRKLTTIDPYDVQFDDRWIYKFNLAIFNDSHGEDHAISWTHALNLNSLLQYLPFLFAIQFTMESSNIPSFSIEFVFITFSAIIFLFIFTNYIYQKKRRE